LEKSWANYESPIVQIWPSSNSLCGILSFLWEIPRNIFRCTSWLFIHIMWSSILEIFVWPDLQRFLGRYFTKKPFPEVRKWKMIFLCKEKINPQHKHWSTSQDAHMCTRWGHLNKLCHGSGHNLAHSAWMPWNFVRDRSFLRRVF
jgi:hypothetical protein